MLDGTIIYFIKLFFFSIFFVLFEIPCGLRKGLLII